MTFLEILLTILIAVVIGILFYYIFRSRGPWGSFWSFLLILILAGLAAEAWIEPVGPVGWGVAWVPTIFVILLFALLLAAAAPPRPERRITEPVPDTEEEATVIALSGFFWIFMIFLLGVVIWGLFV